MQTSINYAYTAASNNGAKINIKERQRNGTEKTPRWQNRLKSKIEKCRYIIGRLTQYNNGNRSRKLVAEIGKLKTIQNTRGI